MLHAALCYCFFFFFFSFFMSFFFLFFFFFRFFYLESWVEMRQCDDEGMDSPAVFQVAHKANVQVFQPAFHFLYGVQVKKGLCRVLVASIASINHRYGSRFCSKPRASLQWMPYYNDISVLLRHL